MRLTNQSYIVQAVVLSEVIDSLLRIAEQNDVLYPISYLYEVMDIRDIDRWYFYVDFIIFSLDYVAWVYIESGVIVIEVKGIGWHFQAERYL